MKHSQHFCIIFVNLRNKKSHQLGDCYPYFLKELDTIASYETCEALTSNLIASSKKGLGLYSVSNVCQPGVTS